MSNNASVIMVCVFILHHICLRVLVRHLVTGNTQIITKRTLTPIYVFLLANYYNIYVSCCLWLSISFYFFKGKRVNVVTLCKRVEHVANVKRLKQWNTKKYSHGSLFQTIRQKANWVLRNSEGHKKVTTIILD